MLNSVRVHGQHPSVIAGTSRTVLVKQLVGPLHVLSSGGVVALPVHHQPHLPSGGHSRLVNP